MSTYFNFVPLEIISLIIQDLNNDDFHNFSRVTDLSLIDWSNLYKLHFGKYRKINAEEYFKYLNLEKVKDIFYPYEDLDELENFDNINNNYINIPIIPKELSYLIYLVTLRLINCNITDIFELGFLSNLEHVDLSENRIEKIHYNIYNLKKLNHLDLRRNVITEVHESMYTLTQLKYLNLSNNKVVLTESLSALIKLENLHIDGVYDNILPDSLTKLINLKVLSAKNKHLVKMPSDLSNLDKLESLFLAVDLIDRYPSSLQVLSYVWNRGSLDNIKNLTHLKILKTSARGKLKDCSSINEISSDLESVVMTTNEIEEFVTYNPGNKVQVLNISYNFLRFIDITEYRNIKALNLSHNRLTSFHESILLLSNLEKMNLSYNILTSIPDQITQLTNLKTLNLNDNKITKANLNFNNLTKLIIHNNQLKTLVLPLASRIISIFNNKFGDDILNLTFPLNMGLIVIDIQQNSILFNSVLVNRKIVIPLGGIKEYHGHQKLIDTLELT